ncbi:MAG TPA: CAP domain-containing protein [Actinomycetota bacterium]|nr:CAP domain-containing protein [Actinomycetota bacterium]
MVRATARVRHRIAVVLLLVLPLLLSGIATDHARAGAAARNRERMLQLTNEVRTDRNRRALELDAELSRYALKHSRDMAEAGSLFHTEDLAARLKGRDWTMGGENVGVASSLSDLLAAFMGSKPHRRNILRRGFDHAAIGVVKSDGSLWVTVIFYG